MGHATSSHALDRVLAYHHPGVCDKLVAELFAAFRRYYPHS